MSGELGDSLRPLPWQLENWQRLQGNFYDNRLPHALLFTGGEGIGKLDFAIALSCWVLCRERGDEGPCGRCKSCKLFASKSHPDFFHIAPQEQGKAILVQEIRGLNEFAGKKSQFGGYRVVLISPADAMNTAASNALLKTLEEPGSDTLIMLLSHMPAKLLATIKSRCQILKFPVPDGQAAKAWLSTRLEDEAQANTSLLMAGGAPLKALDIAQQGLIKNRRQVIDDLLAVKTGQASVLEVAARWQDYDLNEVILWLMAFNIDLAKITAGSEIANADLKTVLVKLSNSVSGQSSFAFHDQLIACRRKLMSPANPNKLLLTEQLLFFWLDLP